MNFKKVLSSSLIFLVLITAIPSTSIAREKSVIDYSKSKLSPEEIIELGYVPNEIIVKFKEAKINNNLIIR